MEIIYKQWIFQWHVWIPEGMTDILIPFEQFQQPQLDDELRFMHKN